MTRMLGEEPDLVLEPCKPISAAALPRIEELDRMGGAVVALDLPDLTIAPLAHPPSQHPGAEPSPLAQRRRRLALDHVTSEMVLLEDGSAPVHHFTFTANLS